MKLLTTLHLLPYKTFRKLAFKRLLLINCLYAFLYTMLAIETLYLAIPIGGTALFFVPLISGLVVAVLIAYTSSRPSVQMKGNKGAFDRRRMFEFDEQGFSIKYDSGSNSYYVWSDIEKVEYRDQCVFLLPSKLYILQVPDSAWPSTKERDQFLSLLRSVNLLQKT